MGADSSAKAQTVSALNQYGLVTVEGRGRERTIALSPLARQIFEGEGPAQQEGMQRAALRPDVFAKIWQRVQAGQADRASLIKMMTEESSPPFNRKAAEEVLRLFGENVHFAKILAGPHGELADQMIESRDRFFAEEVLAMGKIRIEYRGKPDRHDYELLRAWFDAKLTYVD